MVKANQRILDILSYTICEGLAIAFILVNNITLKAFLKGKMEY